LAIDLTFNISAVYRVEVLAGAGWALAGFVGADVTNELTATGGMPSDEVEARVSHETWFVAPVAYAGLEALPLGMCPRWGPLHPVNSQYRVVLEQSVHPDDCCSARKLAKQLAMQAVHAGGGSPDLLLVFKSCNFFLAKTPPTLDKYTVFHERLPAPAPVRCFKLSTDPAINHLVGWAYLEHPLHPSVEGTYDATVLHQVHDADVQIGGATTIYVTAVAPPTLPATGPITNATEFLDSDGNPANPGFPRNWTGPEVQSRAAIWSVPFGVGGHIGGHIGGVGGGGGGGGGGGDGGGDGGGEGKI